jgi:1-acyl-sn-glycerol-3-phosphate acyltransferase
VPGKGDRLLQQRVSSGVARGFFLNGGLRPIIRHYVHPKISGLDNLEGSGPPLILAANHSSHMDTPLILNSLPKDLRRRTLVAAASDYFFSSRLMGLFVSVAIGAVPMERRTASRESMAQVDKLLEEQWCLVMYPEGSRTPDGRLYKGKTGIARLALSSKVPVVPVGIVGTYGAMPAGRSWPVPGQVEVRFGKPLTFERYSLGAANQLVLRAITDQIMYDIMALTGLSYVDEYVSAVKARARQAARAKPHDAPNGSASAEPASAADAAGGAAHGAEREAGQARDVSSG